jgi:uncharacterized protein (DUF58 family)
MSAVLDAIAPPGYAGEVHPTLALIRSTKDKAEQLRSELVAAEREHHEAILAAVQEPDSDGDQARFSIAEIAAAAGVSRGRIYKRLGKPSYGDRSTAKPAYR